MQVIVSCTGENEPGWHTRMENLVLSVRAFGGSLSDASFVVNVVGGAASSFVSRMGALGAEVRVVDAVDPRVPASNKMRMLELASSRRFDVLVALDCDVVVMGDLGPELTGADVRLCPDSQSHLPNANWERIYDSGGLARPEKSCVMAVTGRRTYPYYNGGVLFVSHEACLPLLEHWSQQRERLLALEASEPGVLRTKRRGDQPSLPCALAAAHLDVDPLPINLNLSTRVSRFSRAYRDQWGPPFIFHYHDRIDPHGFLMWSPNPRVTEHLEEFNQRRAEVLGLRYPGMVKPPLRKRAKSSPRYRRVARQLARLKHATRLAMASSRSPFV
jgi:hypothetical protein